MGRGPRTTGQGPSGSSRGGGMDTRGGGRGGGGTTRERDSRGPRQRERGGRQRDGASDLQDRVVEIRRVAKVVKGGRRFNFSALVVVGDGNGRVGTGLGKANTVPAAIQKGQDRAKRNMFQVPMRNTTIPHEGTGVIAGGGVRAVLELAGIKDVLTKALGSTTSVNLVQATVEGLQRLRS